MDQEYVVFLAISGALGKLVVAASVVERVLAFIFEHDWFIRLATKEVPDPKDPNKNIRQSRIPGLKGLLALIGSAVICFRYEFDILHVLFQTSQNDPFGIVVTSFAVAGGSSGAIALFQGYLNISKESRDATIGAKIAKAEAAKQIAVLSAQEAKSKKEKADSEKAEAEARNKIAEAQVHE
ncbi:MAG: hypothetical protein WBI57_09260 [Desulfobacterales bacterium]